MEGLTLRVSKRKLSQQRGQSFAGRLMLATIPHWFKIPTYSAERSPDEFEQQSKLVGDQTAATIRFFARTDADSSTGLLGEGAQAPPLPQTTTCLENQRNDATENGTKTECWKL
jgi:hypothetical protein